MQRLYLYHNAFRSLCTLGCWPPLALAPVNQPCNLATVRPAINGAAALRFTVYTRWPWGIICHRELCRTSHTHTSRAIHTLANDTRTSCTVLSHQLPESTQSLVGLAPSTWSRLWTLSTAAAPEGPEILLQADSEELLSSADPRAFHVPPYPQPATVARGGGHARQLRSSQPDVAAVPHLSPLEAADLAVQLASNAPRPVDGAVVDALASRLSQPDAASAFASSQIAVAFVCRAMAELQCKDTQLWGVMCDAIRPRLDTMTLDDLCTILPALAMGIGITGRIPAVAPPLAGAGGPTALTTHDWVQRIGSAGVVTQVEPVVALAERLQRLELPGSSMHRLPMTLRALVLLGLGEHPVSTRLASECTQHISMLLAHPAAPGMCSTLAWSLARLPVPRPPELLQRLSSSAAAGAPHWPTAALTTLSDSLSDLGHEDPSFYRALQGALLARLPQLAPRELARAAAALVRAEQPGAQARQRHLGALLGAAERALERFDIGSLIALLAACITAEHLDPRFMAAVESWVVSRAQSLPMVPLLHIAKAFRKLRCSAPQLGVALEAQGLARMHQLSSDWLGDLLLAWHWLRQPARGEGAAFVHAVCKRASAEVGAMHERGLMALVVALPRLRMSYNVLLGQVASTSIRQLPSFSHSSLASLAWAMGSAEEYNPHFMNTLLAEARKRTAQLPLESAGLLLWACSRLRHYNLAFWGAAADRLASEDPRKISFSAINMYIQSLARWHHEHDGAYAVLTSALTRHVDQAAPHHLASITWALTSAGKHDCDAVRAVLRRLHAESAAGRVVDLGANTSWGRGWPLAVLFYQALIAHLLHGQPPPTEVLGPLHDACLRQWQDNMKQHIDVTHFQKSVYGRLMQMKLSPRLEVVDRRGPLSIDMVVTWRGLPLALEADGPDHYSRTRPMRMDGHTRTKHRCLRALGWRVVHIPFFEFYARHNVSAQCDYITRKMEEAVLAGSPC